MPPRPYSKDQYLGGALVDKNTEKKPIKNGRKIILLKRKIGDLLNRNLLDQANRNKGTTSIFTPIATWRESAK